MSPSLVAAVLIARDEVRFLPDCLDSLRGVVDEVHVHDTGSTDATPEIAAAAGATVTCGSWHDDFAAARNAAAAGVSATWVLALDADHRVTADPVMLRRYLAAEESDALRVEVDDLHHAHPYVQPETRLYRPDRLSWTGRVHERLGAGRRDELPPGVLRLTHLGNATPQDRIARAERNIVLGRRAIDELAGKGAAADRAEIAHTLMALGRDWAAAEQWQQAADTFETVRDLFPGTWEWLTASDALARLVLATGYDKVCLVLVDQMREAGADRAYCDWLAAQAMAQLGDPYTAAELLAGVTEVVDTAGRRWDPSTLQEISDLVSRLQVLNAR